jgi:hypothetical protein
MGLLLDSLQLSTFLHVQDRGDLLPEAASPGAADEADRGGRHAGRAPRGGRRRRRGRVSASSSSSYPYPTKWGRYMFFIML